MLHALTFDLTDVITNQDASDFIGFHLVNRAKTVYITMVAR